MTEKKKRAFIATFSGEVGTEILKSLYFKHIYSEIVLITNKKSKFEIEELNKLEQRILDFDNITEYSQEFENFQTGFCALESKNSSMEDIKKVYIINNYYLIYFS